MTEKRVNGTCARWIGGSMTMLVATLLVASLALLPRSATAQTTGQDSAYGSGLDSTASQFDFWALAGAGTNGAATGAFSYVFSDNWPAYKGGVLEASVYCLRADANFAYILAEVTASPNAPDVGGSIVVWTSDLSASGQPDRFRWALNQGSLLPCPVDVPVHPAHTRPEIISGDVVVQDGTVSPPADTTPPAVYVPAGLTVNATGPAGAAAAFEATASDDVDGPLAPLCAPASGSAFPIGSTVVSCAATDAAGNTGSASFTVIVRGASPQLDTLTADVQSFNLQQGISNSLDAKLANVRAALNSANSGDVATACNKLGSFIHEVGAQAGNKLTPDQANYLIGEANRIGAVLGC